MSTSGTSTSTASERLVDDVVPPSRLWAEPIERLAYAETKEDRFPPRRNGAYPV